MDYQPGDISFITDEQIVEEGINTPYASNAEYYHAHANLAAAAMRQLCFYKAQYEALTLNSQAVVVSEEEQS